MKDRIAHIMKAKNLKATDFATLLGVQPSGVSHILAGRNKPSLEFVKKIKETFPEYNLDWIIFGTGPMTTSEPFKEPSPITPNVSPAESDLLPFDFDADTENGVLTDPTEMPNDPVKDAGVKSMLILYEDGTFETYSPR
ncbi:MAG: helix-turn-helix transcriptional regulator [Bacteroidales bacterium]|nr:helix-turn-helix transcriptional regulator [Bacteroidales bacterium]